MTSPGTAAGADAVRTWVASYNDREWDAMRSVLAADCVYEEISKPPRRVEGAEAVVSLFREWAKALPGPRASVSNIVTEGNRVAIEFELEGAGESPFGNFRPAGKGPSTFGALFFEVRAGEIASFRSYLDSLALYQIMGIHP